MSAKNIKDAVDNRADAKEVQRVRSVHMESSIAMEM